QDARSTENLPAPGQRVCRYGKVIAVHALKRHLRATVGPLGETFRNPGLRRLQLAWVGSLFGTWFYIVALSVYAYGHGGAGAVGLVGVIRMVPAGLMSPIAATLADRFPRRSVMVWADLIRAALMGGAAVVIGTGGPAWSVYAIATASSITASAFGPAQSALIPNLARTPGELTAANVASSTLDSVAMLAGPAIG